jgi:hypothetical protein
LLPKNPESSRYEFSVETNIPEVVHISEEASRYIESRTDHKTAIITCLALEEMLTGIVFANHDTNEVIDVVIRDMEDPSRSRRTAFPYRAPQVANHLSDLRVSVSFLLRIRFPAVVDHCVSEQVSSRYSVLRSPHIHPRRIRRKLLHSRRM